MSDMQWRKANGQTGTYTGPLVHLGSGIPRQMGESGLRRAVYDLALGYVSGFPVRDILAYSVRSLFRQRGLPVVYATPAQIEWLVPATPPRRECLECGCVDYHALRCPALIQPGDSGAKK